ncbi:MAG: hypothetical protein JRJ56_01505 [Deltaproteobacteria bacterium]|nr:hypothetical protein [Deltaproteobacteria bacterium]
MKCPKCGYTSFDYLSSCSKCGQSLDESRKMLNLLFGKPTLFTVAEQPPEAALVGGEDPAAAGGSEEPPAEVEEKAEEEMATTPAADDEAAKESPLLAAGLGTMDLLADDAGEMQLENLAAPQPVTLDPATGDEEAAAGDSGEAAAGGEEEHDDFLDLNIDLNEDFSTEAAAEDSGGEKVIELQEDQIFDLELELDSEAAELEKTLER